MLGRLGFAPWQYFLISFISSTVPRYPDTMPLPGPRHPASVAHVMRR
jgi:hypothetical protein